MSSSESTLNSPQYRCMIKSCWSQNYFPDSVIVFLVVEKESNVTTGKEAQAETDRVMVRASCRTAVGSMAKN